MRQDGTLAKISEKSYFKADVSVEKSSADVTVKGRDKAGARGSSCARTPGPDARGPHWW